MTFEYNVYEEVYNDIISGKKNIEFRLLNEKSSIIKVGDYIKFKVLNEEKFIKTVVIDKFIYDNLDELWNSNDISYNSLNIEKEEFYQLFYNIFGKENVDNSKIVGFKIKVI